MDLKTKQKQTSIVFTDLCRCRLQLCDDAGPADAVDMTMLHAILRQCRQMSMRSVWPRFISFAREMPANADAVCFARQCFTSFVREMPTDVDAVCTHARTMLPVRLRGKRYCFTSFVREMPTNRRCCPLMPTTLHLVSRGKCRFIPMLSAFADNASSRFTREMPVHTDAVRFCRQCFTSFTRVVSS